MHHWLPKDGLSPSLPGTREESRGNKDDDDDAATWIKRDSKKDYFALVEEESELRSSKKQLGKCSIVGFFNQDIALRPAVREKANYLSNWCLMFYPREYSGPNQKSKPNVSPKMYHQSIIGKIHSVRFFWGWFVTWWIVVSRKPIDVPLAHKQEEGSSYFRLQILLLLGYYPLRKRLLRRYLLMPL